MSLNIGMNMIRPLKSRGSQEILNFSLDLDRGVAWRNVPIELALVCPWYLECPRMSTSPAFQTVLSSMSDSDRRCCFPHTKRSENTRTSVLNHCPIGCPAEIFVQGFCVPLLPQWNCTEFSSSVFEVFKTGSHSFPPSSPKYKCGPSLVGTLSMDS